MANTSTITFAQARAPLNSGEARFKVTAGFGVRGALRRAVIAAECDYFEQKNWLDSLFIVRGPMKQMVALCDALEKHIEEDS